MWYPLWFTGYNSLKILLIHCSEHERHVTFGKLPTALKASPNFLWSWVCSVHFALDPVAWKTHPASLMHRAIRWIIKWITTWWFDPIEKYYSNQNGSISPGMVVKINNFSMHNLYIYTLYCIIFSLNFTIHMTSICLRSIATTFSEGGSSPIWCKNQKNGKHHQCQCIWPN